MDQKQAAKLSNKKIPTPGYPKCVAIGKNKKPVLVHNSMEERQWIKDNPKDAEKLAAPQKAYKKAKADKKAKIAKEKMANLASFVDKT